MKKIRLTFRILIFLLIFINTKYTYAQLNPPFFKEASVILSSGSVLLKWELDQEAIDSSAVVYIYRDSVDVQGIKLIDTISYTSLYYTDNNANANNKARLYLLRAVINEAVYLAGDSKIFPTNFLNYSYDSCKAEVSLNWSSEINNYDITSNVEFIKYEIYISENGSDFEYIDFTTNKNYTITNIQESTQYKFYISAIAEHALGSKSTSNTVSLYSQMPHSPDSIYARSASVNRSTIDLEFEIVPASELTTFKLLRSENVNGSFDTIQTIHSSEPTIFINDAEVKTSKKVYYYKLVSVNNCNIVTMESGIINSVLLNVTNSDFENTLEWNAFGESTNTDCVYKVYRILEGQEPQPIHSGKNYYTYTDNIEDLIATNSGSKICYYVDCMIIENPTHNNSNIDCITIEPKVLVPNAITPNAIDKNCCFKPVFTFLPKDYFLIIYNRWGNVVFETTDPEKSWDGRYPNGQYVPAGAYIFYLKINTENNQSIEKRGNITVIYP